MKLRLDMDMSASMAKEAWETLRASDNAEPVKLEAYFERWHRIREAERTKGKAAVVVFDTETDEVLPAEDDFSRSAPAPAKAAGQGMAATAEEGTARKSDTRKCAETIRKSAQPGDSRKATAPPPKPKPTMKTKNPDIEPKHYPAIVGRIKKALAALGYDQYGGGSAAMKLTGIGTAEWHYGTRTGSRITSQLLDKLAAGLGIGRPWLEHGEGDMLVKGGAPFAGKCPTPNAQHPTSNETTTTKKPEPAPTGKRITKPALSETGPPPARPEAGGEVSDGVNLPDKQESLMRRAAPRLTADDAKRIFAAVMEEPPMTLDELLSEIRDHQIEMDGHRVQIIRLCKRVAELTP